MKKIFSLLLILAVAVSFAACGDDDNDPKPETREKWENWAGDWNDPAHPKYQEYHGKYNPIKGAWQYVDRPKDGYLYSENVEQISITIFEDGTYHEDDNANYGHFQINDKYYKTGSSKTLYRYKIDGDKLYFAKEDNGYVSNTWTVYKKLKEQ